MKRKVTLVDFEDKDKQSIELSKRSTPEERITLLFKLIELSKAMRPENQVTEKKDDLPFITVRKRLS